MSEENKLNDNTTPEQQEKESKKFINIKLNELIDAQRKIFDNNSIEIFYLSEAFTVINIKRELHNRNKELEKQFDDIVATYMNMSNVDKYLEPLLDELFKEFAQKDIDKFHSEKNTNKESEDTYYE
jgi:hypothetical protein